MSAELRNSGGVDLSGTRICGKVKICGVAPARRAARLASNVC